MIFEWKKFKLERCLSSFLNRVCRNLNALFQHRVKEHLITLKLGILLVTGRGKLARFSASIWSHIFFRILSLVTSEVDGKHFLIMPFSTWLCLKNKSWISFRAEFLIFWLLHSLSQKFTLLIHQRWLKGIPSKYTQQFNWRQIYFRLCMIFKQLVDEVHCR